MGKFETYINAAKKSISKNIFLFTLYCLAVIIAFIQLTSTHYINNFIIFRSSFHHLLDGLPLYTLYPDEYFDYFFYNPVFPLLFSPFTLLPVTVGIFVWLLLSTLTCFYVFTRLPMDNDKKKLFMLLIVPDLLNNLQHTQTNLLLLAFMLLTWCLIEKNQLFRAALFICLCFFIKGYGAIIALVVFFQKRWFKVIYYGLFWIICFHAALLLFISPPSLLNYYKDWLTVISSDTIKESYSVYGILNTFHFNNIPEIFILAFAFFILLTFLLSQYFSKEKIPVYTVAFLLIWVIVFNRAAESATYLIAVAGVIFWYLNRPPSLYFSLFFWLTIFITSIFPAGIFPLLDNLRHEYHLKVILCLTVLADIYVYSVRQVITSSIKTSTIKYHA